MLTCLPIDVATVFSPTSAHALHFRMIKSSGQRGIADCEIMDPVCSWRHRNFFFFWVGGGGGPFVWFYFACFLNFLLTLLLSAHSLLCPSVSARKLWRRNEVGDLRQDGRLSVTLWARSLSEPPSIHRRRSLPLALRHECLVLLTCRVG